MRIFRFLVTILIVFSLSYSSYGSYEVKGLHKAIEATVRVYAVDHDGESMSSGILVKKNEGSSWYLTNAHVIRTDPKFPERSYEVAFGIDDKQRHPAFVVSRSETKDLALLHCIGPISEEPITLASKDGEIGDEIFSVGNPMNFRCAVMYGHVSNPEKRGDKNDGPYTVIDMPTVVGMSGSAVCNTDGELIGLNSFHIKDCTIAFCIPLEDVREFLFKSYEELGK